MLTLRSYNLNGNTCQPLTAETQISPCRVCGGQSGTGTGFFLELFCFLLSVSFHFASILITRGINNSPVGGRSSETVSPNRHEQQQ
jgi:hypothetical protein